VIIDCHGHFTTAPDAHEGYRRAQVAALADPAMAPPARPDIGDDELRERLEAGQLRVMRDRGVDHTVISPKASAMQHHVPDVAAAVAWAAACNDLIARIRDLYPDRLSAACQLPQVPGGPVEPLVAELERCVTDLGFVGCLLNPDPSGGAWSGPPLTDPAFHPLYERMVELDVPAMVHVSTSCTPAAHTLGAHYLNADTTVFMQLVEGDLFGAFPDLRLVIPHGGGAVPYHWGRYEGLVTRMERPPLAEHVLRNVWFDTCVYHQPGVDLLHRVVGPDRMLFASEMLGAVRGTNPDTGSGWDDTLRYVDRLPLTDADRHAVVEGNARRVFPRLPPAP
jgi:4-oxalmesaconate hydratase